MKVIMQKLILMIDWAKGKGFNCQLPSMLVYLGDMTHVHDEIRKFEILPFYEIYLLSYSVLPKL